jgi:hypothetical protein
LQDLQDLEQGSLTKKLKPLILILLVPGLLLLLWWADPGTTGFYPRCPFLVVTGLKCPGCGSLRGIHHLLHLNLGMVAANNFLLLLALPYLAVAVAIEWPKGNRPWQLKWRKKLMGVKAIWTILAIVILYWVMRNVFGF